MRIWKGLRSMAASARSLEMPRAASAASAHAWAPADSGKRRMSARDHIRFFRDVGGDHARQARGLGLQQHEGQPLVKRRQHEHVHRRRHQARRVRPQPGEVEPSGQPRGPRVLLGFAPQRPVAHQQKVRVRVRCCARDFDQKCRVLLRHEPRRVPDYPGVARDAEFRPNGGAIDRIAKRLESAAGRDRSAGRGAKPARRAHPRRGR